MNIECTVEEFKELIKKEQTECESECSIKAPNETLKDVILRTL